MNATDTVGVQPLEVRLTAPLLSKGDREYQAFRRLLPSLLAGYRGSYVAIHDEHVLDTDTDDIALIRRVHAKIGYVPIHVGLVTEVPPVTRIPHYRQVKVEGQK